MAARDQLLSLDVADLGAPFVQVATGTFDTAYLATPFAAADSAPAAGNTSSVALPAVIGVGATPDAVFANTSSATLTPPSAQAAGQTGPVGRSRWPDGGAIPLPTLTGSGAGGPVPALPAIAGAASASSGVLGSSGVALRPLAGTGSGNPGVMARSSAALPALDGTGATPHVSSATLPAISGSAQGLVGSIARSSAVLPSPVGEAQGSTPVVGASSLDIQTPRGEGRAFSGSVGASSATLAAIILAAEGTSGAVGSSALAVPVLRGSGTGHVQVVGDSTLTLPAIVSVSTAPTAAPVGQDYTGFALQTQAQALTTYSGVPFNALARFNGVYLASGPGGLFVLEGDTDDGALIDAAVRLGTTSFGSMQLKRVEAMYVNYRADGDLALKVIIDEHEEYDYTLVAHGHDTLTTERVKLGRGAKGMYWQFEITNLDGADFDFDRIEPREQALSRRLG